MVTAIFIKPTGEMFAPRFESVVFDTEAQCQQAFKNPGFYQTMYTTAVFAYPNYQIQTIGCGAWDMSEFGIIEQTPDPQSY